MALSSFIYSNRVQEALGPSTSEGPVVVGSLPEFSICRRERRIAGPPSIDHLQKRIGHEILFLRKTRRKVRGIIQRFPLSRQAGGFGAERAGTVPILVGDDESAQGDEYGEPESRNAEWRD